MKRILLIWPYYYPDPGAAAARGHAFGRILSARHDLWVITKDNKKCSYKNDKPNIKRIHLYLGLNPFLITFSLFQFISYSAKINPDVIITSSPSLVLSFYALLYSVLFFKKLYWDVRDLPFEKRKIKWISNRIIMKLLSIKAKKIFVTTGEQVNIMRSVFNIKNRNVHIVGNGVDIKELKYKQGTQKTIDVVYLGSINHERDPYNLQLLINQLLRINSNMSITFIGYDKCNPYWEVFLKGLGDEVDEYKIKIIEEISYIKAFELVSKAKIGIVSIVDERMLDYQLPVKIFEYMAAGVAVAGLVPERNKEIRQFFEAYNPGIIDASPEILGQKIINLLKDHINLNSISERNLENIPAFDRNRILKPLIEWI